MNPVKSPAHWQPSRKRHNVFRHNDAFGVRASGICIIDDVILNASDGDAKFLHCDAADSSVTFGDISVSDLLKFEVRSGQIFRVVNKPLTPQNW